MNKDFFNLTEDELLEVNGGGLGGAAVGAFAGEVVGVVVGCVAYCNSIRSGSSVQMATKACNTAIVSCMVTGAAIGFYLPF